MHRNPRESSRAADDPSTRRASRAACPAAAWPACGVAHPAPRTRRRAIAGCRRRSGPAPRTGGGRQSPRPMPASPPPAETARRAHPPKGTAGCAPSCLRCSNARAPRRPACSSLRRPGPSRRRAPGHRVGRSSATPRHPRRSPPSTAARWPRRGCAARRGRASRPRFAKAAQHPPHASVRGRPPACAGRALPRAGSATPRSAPRDESPRGRWQHSPMHRSMRSSPCRPCVRSDHAHTPRSRAPIPRACRVPGAPTA